MWWNPVSSRKERIREAVDAWAKRGFAAVPGDDERIPCPISFCLSGAVEQPVCAAFRRCMRWPPSRPRQRLGGFSKPPASCASPQRGQSSYSSARALLEIRIRAHPFRNPWLIGEGGRYLEGAYAGLRQAGECEWQVAAEKERLWVLVPPTFARQMLIPRLPEFLRLHPEIELAVNIAVPMANVSAESADVEVRWGDGNYPEWKVSRPSMTTVTPLAVPAFGAMKGVLVPADLRRVAFAAHRVVALEGGLRRPGCGRPLTRQTVLNDLGMLLEDCRKDLALRWVRRRIAAGVSQDVFHRFSTCAPFQKHSLVASPLSGKTRSRWPTSIGTGWSKAT